MDEMMNSVCAQIQRAISDAISTQVLPQIQNVIMAGSGHVTKKGWDVPSERPELNSEVQRNLNAKNSLRNEQDENQLDNDYPELNVHDNDIKLSKSNLIVAISNEKLFGTKISHLQTLNVNITS